MSSVRGNPLCFWAKVAAASDAKCVEGNVCLSPLLEACIWLALGGWSCDAVAFRAAFAGEIFEFSVTTAKGPVMWLPAISFERSPGIFLIKSIQSSVRKNSHQLPSWMNDWAGHHSGGEPCPRLCRGRLKMCHLRWHVIVGTPSRSWD